MAEPWATLDPDSRDWRTCDWSEELEGSTISGTPTATVTLGDVTIVSTTTASNVQTVWMTGGTPGTLCKVECAADFADGREAIPKVFDIYIRDAS